MDDKTRTSGKQTIQVHGRECLHEIEEITYDLQGSKVHGTFDGRNSTTSWFVEEKKIHKRNFPICCSSGGRNTTSCYIEEQFQFLNNLEAALPNNREISSGHYNSNLLVASAAKPRVLRVDGKDSGSDTASSSDSEADIVDCNEKTGLLKETKSEKKKQLPRERSEIVSLKDITVGDHISFKRKAGYKHHAVVSNVSVKTGRFSIIEVIGNSNPLNIVKVCSSKCLSAGVSETSMEFVNGDEIFKYTYEVNRKDNINPVHVARILMHHGLPQDYHLRKFNCEHFATYCCTAYPYSQQTGTYNKRAKEMLDEIVMTEHSASSIVS